MTAISYTSDLTDIFMFESTTGVSSVGGGAGASAEIDYAIEGTNSVTRKISNTTAGFIWDNTSAFGIASNESYYAWVFSATPTITGTSYQMILGDDSSNYFRFPLFFNIGGGQTNPPNDLEIQPHAIDEAAFLEQSGQREVGTPGTTPSQIGCEMNTSSSVKGFNLAMDACRYGSGYDILHGTGADAPGNFAGIAADDVSTMEGIFQPIPGGYQLLGQLRLGDSSDEVEFTDSNVLVALKPFYGNITTFHDILIENADTIITLDFVTFLGPQDSYARTRSDGGFRMTTATATVDLTSCTFKEFGPTVLGTGATCLGCSWINSNEVDAQGANLSGSVIRNRRGVDGVAGVWWNTNTEPDGLLDDMDFFRGEFAVHAIEFGTSSPLTMTLRNIDFSGYNASDAQDDSTFHVMRTSGTVTLNIIDCTGNFSVETEGATVVKIIDPRVLEITVLDVETGSAISGARVYITPEDNTGPYPFEESVTSINRTGSVATVVHTAHGMADGEEVFIEGAVQPEYNGIQTITNVTVNGYDYTVSGTPTTPATGTIIATAVIINGTTNGSGIISDLRPYTSDQPIDGRVRVSSGSPFYKTGPITGTVDMDNGLSTTIQLVRDD